MLVKKKRLAHLDELVVGLDAVCARLQDLLARLERERFRSA
jgi:ABC-type phosphonate transport system ATPase subunit